MFFQNAANAENVCVVTADVTATCDVTDISHSLNSALSLKSGQLVEVVSAPASDEQDTCLVRLLTSADGREVEAAAQVECWVEMDALRPHTSRDTFDKQGAYCDVTSARSKRQ